jgi:SAM-dependent methyltransferase
LVHGRWIYARRVRVLRDHLAASLPAGVTSVLDVGCGDGLVARMLQDARPELRLEGLDVLVRPHTHVRVSPFDGRRIPFPDASFDAVTFVDVLHHTDDPAVLLAEAARVARRCIVVKDHLADRPLARPTLRLMDWIGNARHGVVLPYNYWTADRWRAAFRALGLVPALWHTDLKLYVPPLDWVFGGSLHCVVRLVKGS